MSKWIVDIHGDIEGDYEIIKKYEEPKTGHWIKDEKMSIVFDIYRCSRCSAGGEPRYNFCPNCGADMRCEQ